MIYQRKDSMTLLWRIAIIDDERSVRSGLSNSSRKAIQTDTFDSAEVVSEPSAVLSGAVLVITDTAAGMSGLSCLMGCGCWSYRRRPCSFISGHADSAYAAVRLIWRRCIFMCFINIDILLDHI